MWTWCGIDTCLYLVWIQFSPRNKYAYLNRSCCSAVRCIECVGIDGGMLLSSDIRSSHNLQRRSQRHHSIGLRFCEFRVALIILPGPIWVAQFFKSVDVGGRRFGPDIEVHSGATTCGSRFTQRIQRVEDQISPSPFPRLQRPTLLFAFFCGFVVKALHG